MIKHFLIRKVWFFKFGELEISFTPRGYQRESDDLTCLIDTAQTDQDFEIVKKEIKRLSDRWDLNRKWKSDIVRSFEQQLRFKQFKVKHNK